MARDHTRVNIDIWGDEEFRELPVDAQALYWFLWTSPERTYCGGHWWHAGKLAQFAGDWTIPRVRSAGAVLSERLFLVIDEPVEECVIRSWIKHDGLWKVPNMAVSMANARAAMASKVCRGVVVHEVKKLATANPDLSSWQRKEVVNLLSQKAIDPAKLDPFTPPPTPPVTPPPTPPTTPRTTPELTLSDGVGVNPPANPARTTATATPTATEGGYVSREQHLGTPPPIPSPYCHRHPEGTATRCYDCGRAREAHNAAKAEAQRQRRELRTNCPWCEGTNTREREDGAVEKCDHETPPEGRVELTLVPAVVDLPEDLRATS